MKPKPMRQVALRMNVHPDLIHLAAAFAEQSATAFKLDNKGILALTLATEEIVEHLSSTAARGGEIEILCAVYGTCIGVGLPLLDALLFSASPPALKGLNTNLALFTMDLAYFYTPYLGGAVISFGADFRLLFFIAGGSATLAMAMITGSPGKRSEDRASRTLRLPQEPDDDFSQGKTSEDRSLRTKRQLVRGIGEGVHAEVTCRPPHEKANPRRNPQKGCSRGGRWSCAAAVSGRSPPRDGKTPCGT